MSNVTIYLPDGISTQARQLHINVSRTARRAVIQAIERATEARRCAQCGALNPCQTTDQGEPQ